jgi:hypothetical protein
MQWKRVISAFAIIATLAAPMAVQAQRGGGRAGGGRVGGGAHGGGGMHFHAPAGGFARGGHYTAPNGRWVSHPAWSGRGAFARWQAGHWWHGTYGGRLGWWWIVGPDWYWYPYEVAAIPSPYTPPGLALGYWYWCPPNNAYYPYVGACPVPWVPEAMQ